jgi:flagellar motor component MotA
LSFEYEMDGISDDVFKEGIRLVIDGYDEESIQQIFTHKIERENDCYKKKLLEIALEGILCILHGDNTEEIAIKLAAKVNIKNNPLDAACAKYLTGDFNAFDDIDLKVSIQSETEREEIHFIKRVHKINEIYCRDSILGIEQSLNNDGIVARDVFEYGLSLIVIGIDYKDIDNILTMLIAHESDPVRKNLSLAKKEAVKMIYEGQCSWLIRKTLLSYFDDDVAQEYKFESDEEENY